MRQRAGLAGTGRHDTQSSVLHRLGDHPLVIRRECFGPSIAEAHGWRSVGVAQENSVGGTSAFPFFFKQDLFAVTADVPQLGPPEPPEFTLLFAVRTGPPNADAYLLGNGQNSTVTDILQPHASGNVGN